MIIASIEDYRKRCEARLPRFLYDYISGGSYQENTVVTVNLSWKDDFERHSRP